jgi:3-phenylpropionate/trans-cinnamate dioxygenase ferredoxin subunit
MQEDYQHVASRQDIAPGQTRRVVVRGTAVLIANVGGTFYAVDDLCTHEDSSLSLGCLKGELVDCTLHGSRFSVITGLPVSEPATEALRCWPVRLDGDRVLVRVTP